MITLEKVLTELKGESLNEIVGGTYRCYTPPSCSYSRSRSKSCSDSRSHGKKKRKNKKRGRGRGRC